MLAQRAYLAIGKADIAGIDRIEILAIAGRLKAILHLAIELEDNRQPLAPKGVVFRFLQGKRSLRELDVSLL